MKHPDNNNTKKKHIKSTKILKIKEYYEAKSMILKVSRIIISTVELLNNRK